MNDQNYATTEAPVFGNTPQDPLFGTNGHVHGEPGSLIVAEEPEPGAISSETPNPYPHDSDPNSVEDKFSFPPETFPNSATQYVQQSYSGVCVPVVRLFQLDSNPHVVT